MKNILYDYDYIQGIIRKPFFTEYALWKKQQTGPNYLVPYISYELYRKGF